MKYTLMIFCVTYRGQFNAGKARATENQFDLAWSCKKVLKNYKKLHAVG